MRSLASVFSEHVADVSMLCLPAGLRYFRAILAKNDDFYNRHLIKNDLFSVIVDFTMAATAQDNLLSSACLEFFESIRTVSAFRRVVFFSALTTAIQSNSKSVIKHLMERDGDKIRKLADAGSTTFQYIIVKWEQQNEPPPEIDGIMTEEEL